MVNCSRSFYLVSFNTFDRGTHSTIFASGAGFDDFLPGFSFNRNPKSLFIPLSLIQYSNCSSLRADPNVLLIKAETTRPHYSSSLSLSPILLPSLQRHERVVFRTVAGHACPRVLYLPSFSRTFHSSLLVTPSGCLCSSHRLFPSITGFALHARTTTHGTHGDAFSHHLRSLSSNSLPSRSSNVYGSAGCKRINDSSLFVLFDTRKKISL